MSEHKFKPGDYVMIDPIRRGYVDQIVRHAQQYFEYACENPVTVVRYNDGGAVETACDKFENWRLRLEEYWWILSETPEEIDETEFLNMF